MAYQWDLFISYRRADPVEGWVHRILHPQVTRWLPHHGGIATPRVYLDVNTTAVAPGAPWPTQLRDAICASRVLLAVLSPDYFESPWCMMELTMMLERAKVTGAPVVYSVQFSDGDFYPPEYQSLAWRPLERFNRYARPSSLPVRFTTEVQSLCKDLGDRWRAAPPFDPTWTTLHPPTPTPVVRAPTLPRFGDG
jgi:hypothetical protein